MFYIKIEIELTINEIKFGILSYINGILNNKQNMYKKKCSPQRKINEDQSKNTTNG